MDKLKILGVTGGIGSGKSTVSRILEDLGGNIIDADRIAKEVVKKGNDALNELADYFGPQILDGHGELDRKKLAAIVFADISKLSVLNRITHRHVVERIMEGIENTRINGKSQLVVLDVPIPLKHGFLDIVDEVWVVTADKDIRVERVMHRSGLSYDETVKRIASQMSEQEYMDIADKIIINNGDLDQLRKEVVSLYNEYCKKKKI